MIVEFLVSLIPPAGGIAVHVIRKRATNRGYQRAIDEARAEAQTDLKARIDMMTYTDHLNAAQGHVCTQICLDMMKFQREQAERERQRPKYPF